MKSITLHQPWATLIAIGVKRIETRSWYTDYRGPLAIHAAKTMPDYAVEFIRTSEPARRALLQAGYTALLEKKLRQTWAGDKFLPAGAIVAVCELVNCVRITRNELLYPLHPGMDVELTQRIVRVPPPEPEYSFGDYTPGRFAWILAYIQPLATPVKVSGAQGLWNWVEG